MTFFRFGLSFFVPSEFLNKLDFLPEHFRLNSIPVIKLQFICSFIATFSIIHFQSNCVFIGFFQFSHHAFYLFPLKEESILVKSNFPLTTRWVFLSHSVCQHFWNGSSELSENLCIVTSTLIFSLIYQSCCGHTSTSHDVTQPNEGKKMFPTRCKRWWNWETDWHASVLWGFLLFLSVGARISSKNFHEKSEKRENRRRELCSRIRKGYAKPYYSRVIVSSPLRSNNNFEPLPWLGARTWRALTKMETDVEYPSQREKGQQQNFLSLVEFFLLPIRE